MTWLILLCCLLLCGCEAEPALPEAVPVEEAPAEPSVVEVPLRILTPVELEVLELPQWSGSDPQEGPAITPQPGDTSDTWDAARIKNGPADGDCTPEELLEKWLAVEGLTAAALEERACGQLLLLVADGGREATAGAYCFTRQKDGSWQAEDSLWNMASYTGKNGIAHNRRRGTNTSPAGLWALTSAFGLEDAPEGLKLPWRDITPQSDWVTDSRSRYFNTWQERDDPELEDRWNSAEHLADYDETYTYACVIEYNTPPYTVPNRGCAIFLHVSDHPTEGCIGLLTEDLIRVLQWLDPYENPHILITGNEK